GIALQGIGSDQGVGYGPRAARADDVDSLVGAGAGVAGPVIDAGAEGEGARGSQRRGQGEDGQPVAEGTGLVAGLVLAADRVGEAPVVVQVHVGSSGAANHLLAKSPQVAFGPLPAVGGVFVRDGRGSTTRIQRTKLRFSSAAVVDPIFLPLYRRRRLALGHPGKRVLGAAVVRHPTTQVSEKNRCQSRR